MITGKYSFHEEDEKTEKEQMCSVAASAQAKVGKISQAVLELT